MTQTMFTEPEERVALREAVKKLAGKYGREYVEKQAREGGKMTEMWLEMGQNGFLGVNIPEEYGGGGGGMSDLAAVLEESAAAGAPLLMMVVSPAICGSHHRPLRHRRAEAALAAVDRRRHAPDGLRHHRGRRRLELPPDHHHRHPRRRPLGAQGPEDLHLRRRRGAVGAHRVAHRGRQDRQAQAGPVRRPD